MLKVNTLGASLYVFLVTQEIDQWLCDQLPNLLVHIYYIYNISMILTTFQNF